MLTWWLFAAFALLTHGARLGSLLIAYYFDIDTRLVDRDFANYWVGAKLALAGQTDLLFDQHRYYEHLKSLFGADYELHSWSYPPHFLMLVTPLGWLEYPVAMAAFLLVTGAMFVFAARDFLRTFAPEAAPALVALALAGFMLMMADFAQNGFLTGALLLWTLARMRTQPAVAGLALALLTCKPQLGFLLPLLALLDRNWALLKWASGFTALLVALSVLCFGLDSWRAYFTQVVPYQNVVMNDWNGVFLWMMPSTFGSLRTLGLGPASAFALQALVSTAALAVMVRTWVTTREPLDRAAALLLGTFLITPYSFQYDMGALSVAASCLALRARARAQPPQALVYAVVAIIPPVVRYLGRADLPLTPLILAAPAVTLCLAARRADRVSG